MADLFPVAGSHIDIGTVLESQIDDFVEADFAGITWTEIDGWQQCGALSDGAQDIATTIINRGRTVHQKGTADAQAMQNVFVINADDPGQLALTLAGRPNNKQSYAFRIRWSDGSMDYFIALVSTSRQGGEANTIMMLNANLLVNSNFVTVQAP